ncbi:MAG: PAS domain S-box protein [Chloroflexi bacterium]|nr:PAS domain S-box protein [Chloroflexota bacterium]
MKDKGERRSPLPTARSAIGGAPELLGVRGFWLIVALFAILASLHYVELSGPLPFLQWWPAGLGLSRHSAERILFLVPITYAGLLFGTRGLWAVSIAALAVMLPRSLFISPAPRDALLESGAVVAAGCFTGMFVEMLRRERLRFAELELAQKALQSSLRAMEQDRRQLAALNETATIVSQSLELNNVLRGAVDNVKHVVWVDAVLLFLLDDAAQEIVLAAHRGILGECAQELSRLKLGEGFNGRVAELGEPMAVEDASRDTRLTSAIVRQENIQSELIVPLKAKGAVLGTLCVMMRSRRRFLPSEVTLLTAIGNQIGMAVENARLYERQREATKQLRASERRYRYLFENANDAIFVHDLHGTIVAANRACERLTGYPVSELVGASVTELLSAQHLSVAGRVEEQVLAGGLAEPCELQFMCKDGREVLVELATNLITSDGQPAGFQHIARDITREKRMQENLGYYVQQITTAQEEERKRIARELHDEAAQSVLVLSHRLDALVSRPRRTSHQALKEELTSLQELSDEILQSLRRCAQDLRPRILDDLGLVAAVEWLAESLGNGQGIATRVDVEGSLPVLSSQEQLLLFRIAQEATSNIRRHAQASEVTITLRSSPEEMEMVICDNGRGFELPEMIGDFASSGRLGLAGMQERARLLGGTLKVHSAPGKGTAITVRVPIASPSLDRGSP